MGRVNQAWMSPPPPGYQTSVVVVSYMLGPLSDAPMSVSWEYYSDGGWGQQDPCMPDITLWLRERSVDTFKLRALVAVLDHRSVSAAAGELARTQSGVSMVLRRLESHYGVQPVQRSARGIAPTGDGEALYACAKEVLRLEGVLQQQLEWERERSHGWVAIGST